MMPRSNPVRQAAKDMLALSRWLRMQIRLARHPMSVSPDPVFDPAFTPRFHERIGRARRYLEFGSGSSTLIATAAGVPTTAVESDAKFAEAVRNALGEAPQTRVLCPDIGMTENWGYPVFTSPTAVRLARWRTYVDDPFVSLASPESFPDMVLVDGRFRVACALTSVAHAERLGVPVDVYIDDYAPRPYYHHIEQWLGTPEMIGRVARFDMQPGKLAQPISEADLTDACTDYR